MDFDSKILCFKHCDARSIFCKVIPDQCPLCHSILADYLVQPFVLPYCCSSATENAPSIVLKPTEGTFLNDYNLSSDLHIGVVNSEGHLFEYDHRGITVDAFSQWLDCVVVKIVPESWYSHWDLTLASLINQPEWIACNYSERDMNCCDFVTEFLRKLNYPGLNFTNKSNLCKQLLIPKLRYTLRYIYLHRNLINSAYYVV